MGINKKDINIIIDDGAKLCYDIDMRDISFVLLCRELDEKESYNVIFGKDGYDEYAYSPKISFIKNSLGTKATSITKKKPLVADVSFEENKAALIELLSEIKEASTNGDLEKKDAIKMESDIRTRLNDKFGASEKTDQSNIVLVEPKFNYICPYTKRECYVNSKKECMKRYNLTEIR